MKLTLLFFLTSLLAFSQTEIVSLYPYGVPGLIAEHGLEEMDITENPDGVIRLKNVSDPSLTIFRPSDSNNSGTGVIICPGGAYAILAINLEGYDLGEWFAEHGVTAFVLKYRLPQKEMYTDRHLRPLQDVQQAFRLIRANSEFYDVNPDQIGIMGFSAGGHLAATASTHFASQVGEIVDENISVRPDFSLLIYPVISFKEGVGHMGSRWNLIGEDLSRERIDYFSNELLVNENTPPAFMVHAFDDPVLVENTLAYVQALRASKVPVELHLFEKGGHGFGMGKKSVGPVSVWPNRLQEWMKSKDLMK